MTRKRTTAPRLSVAITEDQWNRAVRSASGGCLVADAIKTQYPNLSKVTVDMATIRASDVERGQRYTWLTPGPAQHLLLAFDQGWRQPTEQVNLRDAVKITRMTQPSKPYRQNRQQRFAELEEKEADGSLTAVEARSLQRIRNTDSREAARTEPLPTSTGPVTEVNELRTGNATVVGGRPLPVPTPDKHPNLLAGRDRHYGAKLAQPGLAFQEAVEKAVAEHLANVAGDDGGATRTVAPAAEEA